MPLIKSYMRVSIEFADLLPPPIFRNTFFIESFPVYQTNLEHLAEEDAIKKSDAAREAFLAELALDSSKVVRDGSDRLKHGNDKKKDKKRHKEQQKTKDSKVSVLNELVLVPLGL